MVQREKESLLTPKDYSGWFCTLLQILLSLEIDPLHERRGSIFIAEGQRAESWPSRFPPPDLPMIITACNITVVIGLRGA